MTPPPERLPNGHLSASSLQGFDERREIPSLRMGHQMVGSLGLLNRIDGKFDVHAPLNLPATVGAGEFLAGVVAAV
ncbi:hypothetical protein GHK39_19415 [Sinorhizobium medicae]|nr:hypothetical protein [Sinorhizobium medicae]MDX0469881.1 hypothetical protein [Sinorhizobium medicae]MDX0476044.1 hypothetical protein [Sinorhizobium medicae]MDX0901179.1 hypothetical protein [Sinorhizobium medicae]MDX1176886.1 hypothetical protein [Sinorhizobium medicae]